MHTSENALEMRAISNSNQSVDKDSENEMCGLRARPFMPIPMPLLLFEFLTCCWFCLASDLSNPSSRSGIFFCSIRTLPSRKHEANICSAAFDYGESELAISRITDAHFDSFKTNGVVCLRRIFSSNWIDELRNELHRRNQSGNKVSNLDHFDQYFADLVESCKPSEMCERFGLASPAAAVACRLMDSDQVLKHPHCNLPPVLAWIPEAHRLSKAIRW